MNQRILTLSLPSVSLLCLLACGGGSSTPTPPPTPTPTATMIAYTDPANVPAASYYLKKSSLAGTHLVLELYGPVSTITAAAWC